MPNTYRMHWIKISRVLTIAILFGALALSVGHGQKTQAAPFTPGGVANYPHIALYDGNRSWGYPLVHDDGVTLDTATLDAVSRFSLVTLEVTPFTDIHTDVLDALRARNPNIKILAYNLPFFMWVPYNDPRMYYQKLWAFANDSDVNNSAAPTGPNENWLYLQDGTKLDAWLLNINLAKRVQNPDLSYTYVVAEGLADLLINNVINKTDGQGRRIVDGLFLDGFAYDVDGLDDTFHFDFVRAGYQDDQSFRDGWKAAVSVFANRLRQAAGADFIISANGGNGTSALAGDYNGWMYENFPAQEGGSWYTNMFWVYGGYYFNEGLYRQPTYNFLNTWTSANTPTSPNYLRALRFGLASTSMASGWSIFGDGARATDDRAGGYRYDLWWFDEYAVNPLTGRASTSVNDVGWLGQPTSAMYQIIQPNGNPERISNGGFETDTTGWTTGSTANGSVVREVGGAAVGGADLRLHSNITSDVWYLVSTVQALPGTVTANETYTATFWAKASTARRISVLINPTGMAGIAEQLVPLTTEWKQYQVVLKPNASGAVNIRFDAGETPGDVWLDDIHFQIGGGNIYRRDFDHGTVLVNPGATAQTVTLGQAYTKILGTADPVTNNGTTVTSVTVPPSDGLFLHSFDLVPPAEITNFQAQ